MMIGRDGFAVLQSANTFWKISSRSGSVVCCFSFVALLSSSVALFATMVTLVTCPLLISWTAWLSGMFATAGVCERYAYSSASPMTTRSRVRMPFLKMRLSSVVGLSLCPVGALLSTMLPVRGYQGSFLRGVIFRSDRSEGRSAGTRRRSDPWDPHDSLVGGDQRPFVAFARGDLRVGEHVLDLLTPR